MKIFIVEDSRLARQELRTLLAAVPDADIVGEAAELLPAREAIEQLQPELLLLDVELPGATGFDLLDQLEHLPLVVFTTAYDQHALAAFERNALDYLLKPFSRERFDEAVGHALREAAPSTAEVAQALGTPSDAPLTRLLVRDQGIGIPAADQEKLFDTFHRARNVGAVQGTGLGLAIVKRAVELHGGTIRVSSVENEGTTFHVVIPVGAATDTEVAKDDGGEDRRGRESVPSADTSLKADAKESAAVEEKRG